MTYIKKLVMHGFKSFPSKTEVLFDKGINVVVGPNGSGKSNISDALCFALGRLSMKSIRAAKARNLLFMGTKHVKPAREASVDIIFDNSSKTFPLDREEVSLTRIVKYNGQSIYKINGEVKTRNEVIELLGQAGIDPYGFNIVLQGQIQAIVRVPAEERREIIEDVAGISVYETRKEQSIKELEKTEEKLKEISAILRERSNFLKNLEKERSQALRFKDLELTIKRCKASILDKKINEKQKELDSLKKAIETKLEERDKKRSHLDKLNDEIHSLTEKMNQINRHIQKSAGVEQGTLKDQIGNLKAELEGLRARKESYENRKEEIQNRIDEMKSSIPGYEEEISNLKKESPLVAKKQAELAKKKEERARIEEEKKKIYAIKTELNSLKDRIRDKESQKARNSAESDSLLKQIESHSASLVFQDAKSCEKSIAELKSSLSELKEEVNKSISLELEHSKSISVAESRIKEAERVKKDVEKIDVCPLCHNKMTQEHLSHVIQDSDKKISISKEEKEKSESDLIVLKKRKEKLVKDISDNEKKLRDCESEISSHKLIADRQAYLKNLVSYEQVISKEIADLISKRESLEKKSTDASRIEERYGQVLREIEEISSRTEENIDQTLEHKERELERMKEIINLSKEDISGMEEEITDLSNSFQTKSKLLETKEKEEEELNRRFKQLFKDRDDIQSDIQKKAYDTTTMQVEISQLDEQINHLKIGNAQIDAQKQTFEMEASEYSGLELLQGSISNLEERLKKNLEAMQTIGSINMRALEVYEEIKQQYDEVLEKTNTLEKEKEEIAKIIAEIDQKKKKTFMKTFNGINDLFVKNFASLFGKGQASLEIENKEDIFAGGVNIAVKMGKGKYFDVTSLSGGEQTMVALSLLFAIQEFKPHHLYIFDEIDAALDKRNSERLSALLKQYMKSGQYIVITHNDAIILDTDFLYGVSMHDGVSKILSYKLKDKSPK